MNTPDTITGKRILITGGAGFIGSRVCERLSPANDLYVFDSLRRNALATAPWSGKSLIRVIEGDVTQQQSLIEAVRAIQPHLIFHMAAVAGIDSVIKRPTETMLINMVGTANALTAARESSVLERFIDFSTSEVFGSTAFRADETQDTRIGAVGEARWTYAVSKLAGEHLTEAFHQEFNLPTVSVRPFNIYGPGQVGEGAMKTFIQRALADEPIQIHGDGSQIRAWCYVDDFLDGLLRAAIHPVAVGSSFNIGNARAVTTILGLAETVLRVLNSNGHIEFIERHSADVELRIPSVVKAREVLGFQARVSLEDGIRRTAEAMSAEYTISRQGDTARRIQAAMGHEVEVMAAVQP